MESEYGKNEFAWRSMFNDVNCYIDKKLLKSWIFKLFFYLVTQKGMIIFVSLSVNQQISFWFLFA